MKLELFAVVLCVFVNWVQSSSEMQLQCPSQSTSSARISISSAQNQKGNWVTKLDLERGGRRSHTKAMSTELWSVEVDSSTRVCEGVESTLHTTLTLTAPLPKVGPDYELFPGIGFYKFHTTVKTWVLARQTCAEEGTHLAILNSEKEHEVMKTLLARFPTISGASSNGWAWIGMHKKGDEFLTIFGDALNTTGFLVWASGHPNKNINECGLVHRNGGMGQVTWDWKVAFVCEQEL